MTPRITSLALAVAMGMTLAACQEEEAPAEEAAEQNIEEEVDPGVPDSTGGETDRLSEITENENAGAGGSVAVTGGGGPEADATSGPESDIDVADPDAGENVTDIEDTDAAEDDSAAEMVEPGTDPAVEGDTAAEMTDGQAAATVAGGDGASSELENAATDVGDASEDATDAAVDAAQSGEAPVANAQDTAENLAEEEGVVGAEGGSLEEILTLEDFDEDRIIAAIENSEMNDTLKQTLTTAVDEVRGGNDVAKAALIERLRTAFDLPPAQ
ncbi:hypothetical protein E2L08_09125 [Palleronia sediminis]|uniref:Uncharacterized protein n=1 Tax=Palleronia sediminis TaxID=2547833 RepID=A0A4R6A9U2_9RHOB|nr:hypothetical protein [Palleronia sediminis]TDL79464.1 hypothetical protein E2L08_09125 [Palleronia sediminis]